MTAIGGGPVCVTGGGDEVIVGGGGTVVVGAGGAGEDVEAGLEVGLGAAGVELGVSADMPEASRNGSSNRVAAVHDRRDRRCDAKDTAQGPHGAKHSIMSKSSTVVSKVPQ